MLTLFVCVSDIIVQIQLNEETQINKASMLKLYYFRR